MKTQKREVSIQTEFIKLDALLKFAGFAETGGRAKEMIEEGAVCVNGEKALQRGKKIRPGDQVQIDDYSIEVVSGAL